MLKEKDILLGKYRILSKIAAGGMGAVWLAEDRKLQKKWAVKEIFKDSGEFCASVNPDGTLTEIEILTLLDNPYAPRIVDRYEDEQVLAVVMDYVEGQTLLQLVKEKGPQPEEEVVKWTLCVCDLLSFLHTHQPPVIYNDVKPENIILKKDGAIKVIDFGIAKIPQKYPNDTPIGTPGYASPEHYKGKTDARSDLYSLGMSMYHLLTAVNPATKDFHMKPLTSLRPGASRKLEQIIQKATAKDPNARYQSASELREDLLNYQMEQFAAENTKTMLLPEEPRGEEEKPKKEDERPKREEKVSEEVQATVFPQPKESSPPALLLVSLHSVKALFRILLYAVIGVFVAIGITTLLEPALREVFLELLKDAKNIIFAK